MGENIYAKTKLIGNYRTIANLLIISKHDIDKKAAVVEPIMSKAANSYKGMLSCWIRVLHYFHNSYVIVHTYKNSLPWIQWFDKNVKVYINSLA